MTAALAATAVLLTLVVATMAAARGPKRP